VTGFKSTFKEKLNELFSPPHEELLLVKAGILASDLKGELSLGERLLVMDPQLMRPMLLS